MVNLSQLESHLWESANILRGLVDAADFKANVFPLLFFKRISDVHDEEYQAALAEAAGDEEYAQFSQNYRFQIPDDCHWADVRKVAANVGQALQKAMRGIEKANPETLYGIFGDAQWTNKDRLPDSLLRDLIEHFSAINLDNQAAVGDVLVQERECLIMKFAEDVGHTAEFYTTGSNRPNNRAGCKEAHPGYGHDPSARYLLSEDGCQTRAASNSLEALEMIGALIELVLLDLQMPGKDGWEPFESLS
jgi:type I restriction enzyme M protein